MKKSRLLVTLAGLLAVAAVAYASSGSGRAAVANCCVADAACCVKDAACCK
jgi:hypothetical protein